MDANIKNVLNKISQKLSESGFKPFEEFSAVDSLIYKDSCIGIYAVKDCAVAGETLTHDSLTFGIELDYSIEIKLMGSSCDYVDYKGFSDKCESFFFKLIDDEDTLMRGVKLGKAFQSLPLKRLERDITFNARILITEAAEQNELS